LKGKRYIADNRPPGFDVPAHSSPACCRDRFTLRRESSQKREGLGDEPRLAAFSLADVVAVDLDG
jgi:hypothetical protein